MDDGFPDTGIIRSFLTTTDAIAATQAPTGGTTIGAAAAGTTCYFTDGKDDYFTSEYLLKSIEIS